MFIYVYVDFYGRGSLLEGGFIEISDMLGIRVRAYGDMCVVLVYILPENCICVVGVCFG